MPVLFLQNCTSIKIYSHQYWTKSSPSFPSVLKATVFFFFLFQKPYFYKQVSTSFEEDHTKEIEQLEKEHSEIEEELQLWVEDGDQENKTLEEIIEKTNEENVKLWVQITVMKKELEALRNENNTLQTKLETKMADAGNMLESSNEVCTSCDEKHKKELAQLEKEHSEIEEELQQWVEDENQKTKALEEVIETTNEENAKLLGQISGMKKDLKALENENKTLQTELKTKRADLKSLRVNEHYHERELRNLKRDLKRKELSLDNALAEKQELLDDIEYLERSLGDSQAATELLNGKIDELKDMVKELNKRPDQGNLREEVELLKGSLELFRSKEELLGFQVDALKFEVSHFKACDVVIENLMRDLESEMLETYVLGTALEFSLDNCAINEKVHASKTRNLECLLQQMKFLLNITDSCSDADGSKNQVCVCREKFFAM